MIPNKGLFTDTVPQNQPEGTCRFALNALYDSPDGSIGVPVGEHGNRLLARLDGALVGEVPLFDNQSVLFTEPGTIYLLQDEILTVLYTDPAFNFTRKYPIVGASNIVNGCERVVYWCDGVNPDRFFNIDKPERFTTLNDFRLNPLVGHPVVSTETVTGGGYIKYGAYTFVIEVLDETTNVILRTLPSSVHYIGSALNIDNFTEETGGQPPSSDAISLIISNLNEDFPFVRIGVIGYNAGNGVTPIAHYINDLVSVTGDTIEFTYRGYNPQAGDTLTDFRQLLTNNPIYETCEVMRSVQGSLLRFAPTEQVEDFSAYQRAASAIEVHYTTKLVDADEILDVKSEQGDEIRALGIVFVKANGSVSPVFHIPGRPRLATDVLPVENPVYGSVQRWRAENTAYRTSETDDTTEGKCGYYEVDAVYRRPINFCGEDYWGTDYAGNSLLEANIRHHRIPCRTLEPLMDGDRLRVIGLKFSNINYPEGVVGHFIVSNQLSKASSTVLASGYMLPYNTQADVSGDKREGRYIHYLPNPNDNEQFSNSVRQNFISLEYLTSGKPPQAQAVKINGYVATNHTQNRPEYDRFFENGDTLFLYGKHHDVTNYVPQSELIGILSSRSVARGSTTANIPNKSLSSDFNIVTLPVEPTVFALNRSNLNYSYLKRNIIPFPSLFSIKYRVYGKLSETEIYDGDVFISRLDLTNISDINGSTVLHNIFSRDRTYVEYELIRGLYLESPINFNRRHEGSEPCNQFYTADKDIDGVIANKIARRVDEGNTRAWVLRERPCKEWYGYNLDYTLESPRLFVALVQVFDYCSRCLNKYPNRIIYSQFALAEQTQDAWRVYAALDYVDIPASRGGIVGADLYQNDLLIRCKRGVFVMKPNAQELQFSGTTAYLGSGKFLSIPVVELDSSPNGYGGQQSKLGSCMTPHGIVWVDQGTGKVFMFNSKLTEISRAGLYQYFTQNMKPSKAGYFTGAVVGYDPMFERVIVNYKEFEGDATEGFYETIDGEVVPYTDDRLVHKGFTLSYSLKTQSWTSWHSYHPAFMLYYGNKFLTTKALDNQDEDLGLYVHDNFSQMHVFYGKAFPFIIEVVEVIGKTSQLSSVDFYTETQRYDNGWVTVREKTFDQMLAYTNQQSSGLVDLLLTRDPYQQAGWLANTKIVSEADQNYRVGGLRDMSINQPVMTTNWLDRVAYYNGGQGYIDSVPTNINFDLPQFEQVYLRDKFVRLRFFFNDNNSRILFLSLVNRNFPTLR